jgi:cold shock CspA family protein
VHLGKPSKSAKGMELACKFPWKSPFTIWTARIGPSRKSAREWPNSRESSHIAEMRPEENFGFLLTKEGSLLYFHRNSVLSGDFDQLSRGNEVHYNEVIGDTGPIATKVRVKTAG